MTTLHEFKKEVGMYLNPANYPGGKGVVGFYESARDTFLNFICNFSFRNTSFLGAGFNLGVDHEISASDKDDQPKND